MTTTFPANLEWRSGGATGNARMNGNNAVEPLVEINSAREYPNWGAEFLDDAFRLGEQPFLQANKIGAAPADWRLPDIADRPARLI